MICFRLIAALPLSAASLIIAPPAQACVPIVIPTVCSDPQGCSGPLYEQRRAERERDESRAYGRALAGVVDQRAAAPALDMAYDLTRALVPNVVALVRLGESECGADVSEYDADGHDSISDALAISAELSDAARRDARLRAPMINTQRVVCNDAARRAIADYLRTAIPADRLRETWQFVIPRTGMAISADPTQPVTGQRLVSFVLGRNGALEFHDAHDLPYVADRRERANEYLRNHRNGRAVMAAITAWLAVPRGNCPS